MYLKFSCDCFSFSLCPFAWLRSFRMLQYTSRDQQQALKPPRAGCQRVLEFGGKGRQSLELALSCVEIILKAKFILSQAIKSLLDAKYRITYVHQMVSLSLTELAAQSKTLFSSLYTSRCVLFGFYLFFIYIFWMELVLTIFIFITIQIVKWGYCGITNPSAVFASLLGLYIHICRYGFFFCYNSNSEFAASLFVAVRKKLIEK